MQTISFIYEISKWYLYTCLNGFLAVILFQHTYSMTTSSLKSLLLMTGLQDNNNRHGLFIENAILHLPTIVIETLISD